ncbi:MAG: PilZ domain-containing protein [Candidatus Methylomirabilia bacterium]
MRSSEEAMSERRRSPRVPVAWPVTVTDGAGRQAPGRAMDVSLEGMKVQFPELLPQHRFLLLSCTPPDGAGPLWVDVRIARRTTEDVCGLNFLRLSPLAAERLAPFVQGPAEA